MMVDMIESIPPILDKLFAVIVPATFNGDVYWDREGRRWLGEDQYGKGWRIQEPPTGESTYEIRTRVPDPDALVTAAGAANTFIASKNVCDWCGVNELAFHVVVPDIFGVPGLRCVLRPDPIAVDSSGGGGEKKHWAYAAGMCPSVQRREIRVPGQSYGPLLGVNLLGEPLTTVEALERRWCAKCHNAAWTQRENRRYELEAALARTVTADELGRFETACNRRTGETHLLSYMRSAANERDITDVGSASNASWRPLTAEAFVEEERRYGGSL